jgi:hypothetical protein
MAPAVFLLGFVRATEKDFILSQGVLEKFENLAQHHILDDLQSSLLPPSLTRLRARGASEAIPQKRRG